MVGPNGLATLLLLAQEIMKYIASIVLLFAMSFLQVLDAQVVNTERKRRTKGDNGWDGSADLGFSIVQNTRSIITGSSKINVQYDNKQHMLLLLNDLKLMKVDQASLQNSGFQHIRYNYKFRKYLIPEAFVQGQFNQLWKVDFRFLAGVGPRFQLLSNDSTRIHVGTLVMYEFERVDKGLEYNRDFRFSTYGSVGFGLGKSLTLENITYFQPLIKDIYDFRVSSETSVRVAVSKKLGFKTGFTFNYDTQPAEGLPDVFYSFVNSLSYRF